MRRTERESKSKRNYVTSESEKKKKSLAGASERPPSLFIAQFSVVGNLPCYTNLNIVCSECSLMVNVSQSLSRSSPFIANNE